MSSLRRGVQNSDNISRGRDTNNQTGEMFRTFQDIVNPQVANRAGNVVNSMKNSSILGPIIQGYDKVEPYLPEVNLGDETIEYEYERPVGPGIFSLGGEYDYGTNDYGLDFGYKFSFNNGGSVPRKQRQNNFTAEKNADRATYTGNQGKAFEGNIRGKDRYKVNVGPPPSRDTTGIGGFINRLDRGNIGYADMLNRMFGLPFNQEYLNYRDKFGNDYDSLTGEHLREYHTSSERQPGFFNDGGIATLTEDLEQRMTTPDPQMIEPKKLTDEQKDYLYDYMLDFMFKQKQREQQEMEGRIPPFNYEGLEV